MATASGARLNFTLGGNVTLKQQLKRNLTRSILIGLAGIVVMFATNQRIAPPYSHWGWELLPGALLVVAGFIHFILKVRCPYCKALAAVQEYRRLYIPSSCPCCGKSFDIAAPDA